MKSPRRHGLTRKLATLAAVLASGFLAGWSSMGVSGGVALALALGSGTAVPIFTQGTGGYALRRPRKRGPRQERASGDLRSPDRG